MCQSEKRPLVVTVNKCIDDFLGLFYNDFIITFVQKNWCADVGAAVKIMKINSIVQKN